MDDVENGVVVKEDLEEQKPSVQEETTVPENSRDLNTPNGDLPQRKELSNSDCSRYKPCLAVRIIAPLTAGVCAQFPVQPFSVAFEIMMRCCTTVIPAAINPLVSPPYNSDENHFRSLRRLVSSTELLEHTYVDTNSDLLIQLRMAAGISKDRACFAPMPVGYLLFPLDCPGVYPCLPLSPLSCDLGLRGALPTDVCVCSSLCAILCGQCIVMYFPSDDRCTVCTCVIHPLPRSPYLHSTGLAFAYLFRSCKPLARMTNPHFCSFIHCT